MLKNKTASADKVPFFVVPNDNTSTPASAVGSTAEINQISDTNAQITIIKETDRSFKVIAAALNNLGKLLIINSRSINTPYYI